jgi:hypothetical protein
MGGLPFSIDAQGRQFHKGQQLVESVVLLDEKTKLKVMLDRWEAQDLLETYELVFLVRKKNKTKANCLFIPMIITALIPNGYYSCNRIKAKQCLFLLLPFASQPVSPC